MDGEHHTRPQLQEARAHSFNSIRFGSATQEPAMMKASEWLHIWHIHIKTMIYSLCGICEEYDRRNYDLMNCNSCAWIAAWQYISMPKDLKRDRKWKRNKKKTQQVKCDSTESEWPIFFCSARWCLYFISTSSNWTVQSSLYMRYIWRAPSCASENCHWTKRTVSRANNLLYLGDPLNISRKERDRGVCQSKHFQAAAFKLKGNWRPIRTICMASVQMARICCGGMPTKGKLRWIEHYKQTNTQNTIEWKSFHHSNALNSLNKASTLNSFWQFCLRHTTGDFFVFCVMLVLLFSSVHY